jgi:threonine dehydrogenase-like Zn-dependent dehydrogenase
MKAITVLPGKAQSAHVADVPQPSLDEISGGRGVLVKVLRVGIDGTDKEIDAGEYGAAPPGSDFLIMGHESFGIVEEVGPAVTELTPGDYVTSMVSHPGSSIYDTIGMPDMTTDAVYHEHGINQLHGFLREYYVNDAEYLIKVPRGLKKVGVLLEPTSVIEKGILQAYKIQRRLGVWRPKRAAVLGAGSIGLLATLGLRLRGLQVVTFGLEEPPYLNSELVETIGATYISTRRRTLTEVSEQEGAFDLIFGAAGYTPLLFEAMRVLGKNGVLVASSVTGGHRELQIPADEINLGFVLGNKVLVGTVNASREDFEEGVRDLAMSEAEYPGWLERLFTRKVDGLQQCPQEVRLLETRPGSIKTFVEVAPLP